MKEIYVSTDVETDGPIPSPPYIFDPTLSWSGRTIGWPIGSGFYTHTQRELVFGVAMAGSIEVGWHLERRADAMAVGGGVLTRHNQTIEVLDVSGEQVFRLKLKADALEKLVASPPF